eukprot:CAMPEP_0171438132 /NCGR_PEP_ID=MMETSP0881-20121228/17563_1 /TAXON_ID=67004 /ORGANISM="Thalassiosira weissflogii, Strain CCMP1336" /LENGTH=123 /DNA_ID=CAMNT_0011959929 /DNA_START=5 /DNA_END=373 /DNA_ORIENTATION=+
MTTTKRGPLAPLVDAIRVDNRFLFLDMFRRDGNVVNVVPPSSSSPSPSDADAAPPMRHELIFGSDDLRRLFFHRVASASSSSDATKTTMTTSTTSTTTKHKTLREEERDVLASWNEELGGAAE